MVTFRVTLNAHAEVAAHAYAELLCDLSRQCPFFLTDPEGARHTFCLLEWFWYFHRGSIHDKGTWQENSYCKDYCICGETMLCWLCSLPFSPCTFPICVRKTKKNAMHCGCARGRNVKRKLKRGSITGSTRRKQTTFRSFAGRTHG